MHKRSKAANFERQMKEARSVMARTSIRALTQDLVGVESVYVLEQADLWNALREKFREPDNEVVKSFFMGEIAIDGEGEGTLQRPGVDIP